MHGMKRKGGGQAAKIKGGKTTKQVREEEKVKMQNLMSRWVKPEGWTRLDKVTSPRGGEGSKEGG